jgi:glycosyltransferase involved in cell wall biosynthesis
MLLVCTQAFGNGGIQRFNRTLLDACREIGLPYDIYSMGDEAGAPEGTTTLSFRGNKLRFAAATTKAILSNRYDLIFIAHINYLMLIAGALRLRFRARPKVFLVAHGIDVWYDLEGVRRRALGVVDRILCVSSYTQGSIQRQAPEIPQDRYVIFPNALNASWTECMKSAPAASARTFGPAQSSLPERFIFSVSRLSRGDRYKGICTVLEALASLEDPGIQYLIAGEGDDRRFLQAFAAQLGVSHRVRFLGSVSDTELIELYRRCDAFVLPSGKEGFGIVFLEAMYFGAPVIAAAAKGALDVVRHEDTGLLVPFGDVVGLKAALDRMVRDRELRDRLRGRARGLVTHGGIFTFEAFTRRWARIINS